MENTFCPYPGLRPYTEEESVYFKGRDEQIVEISKMLETKKFLMVTGASGDGKSSLIFAGVMPYARAGLLKANFNNWTLADFRPERNPLDNLAQSVAKALNLDYEHVSQELQYGFSALIDLYKESSFYEDFNSGEWLNVEDESKKKRKRTCANLLILVDQFEEFFTNKENYHKGNPSDEAQNVVNLLLETARIAQANDIPIYIICTMRSDFIGQCASFRNLPEYIGHSHFFVPRLKRQEIRQVIEEPAILSGIEINSGLIEVLINSISDGFDQLPLLQHALHQIWRMAVEESNSMSLIHLAKIGGIDKKILSESDHKIYDDWFKLQPEYKVEYLRKSGLGNTLDLHANELYETAYDVAKGSLSSDFNVEKVKLIIQKTFQCLTKIDDGRGVRNRMSVNEILNILNENNLSLIEFSSIINVFRTQGNTFINPFIFKEEDEILNENSILDITHESLIRNWDKLKEWSIEEDKSFQTYLDFKKQLNRWENNEKSRGFLLPIGPLTHFEDWHSSSNINKFWIKKYESDDYTEESASAFIDNSQVFIKKSRFKNLFGLILLKHGFEKVFNTFLVFVVFLITIYFWIDIKSKTNDIVLNSIYDRTESLYTSPYVDLKNVSHYIILREIDEKGKGIELISKMEDTLAVETAFAVLGLMNVFEPDGYVFVDKLYQFLVEKTNKIKELKYLNSLIHFENQFLKLGYDFIDVETRDAHILEVYNLVKDQVSNDTIYNPNEFISSIRYLSYYRVINGVDLSYLRSKISPYDSANTFYSKNFNKSEFIKTENWQNSDKYSHNGGYLALAYLSLGIDIETYSMAIDSLLLYSSNAFSSTNYYSQNCWTDLWNVGAISDKEYNAILIDKLIKHNQSKKEELIVDLERSKTFFFKNFQVPFAYSKSFWKSEYLFFGKVHYDIEDFQKTSEVICESIDNVELSKNEKLFLKSMHFKLFSFYSEDYEDSLLVYNLSSQSNLYYDSITTEFKNKTYKGILNNSNSNKEIKVSTIFHLPNPTHQDETQWEYVRITLPENQVKKKSSNVLIEKLLSKSHLEVDSIEYSRILNEIIYLKILSLDNEYKLFDTISEKELILNISSIAKKSNIVIDTLALSLYLNVLGEDNWNDIDTSLLLNKTYINGDLYNETAAKNCLIGHVSNKRAELYDVEGYLNYITEEPIKVKHRVKIINNLLDKNLYNKAIPYINEFLTLLKTKDKSPNFLAKILGHLDGEDAHRLANYLIKNVKDESKPMVIKFYFEGLLKNKSYHYAIQLISPQTSDDTELLLLNQILKQKILNENNFDKIWLKILNTRDWIETNLMYNMSSGGNVFYF